MKLLGAGAANEEIELVYAKFGGTLLSQTATIVAATGSATATLTF